MNSNGNKLPIVEALILSSPEPLPRSKIISIIQDITACEIDKIVTELNEKYLMSDSSFRIRKIAGGYQVYITENYAGYVEELFTRRRIQKLTRAALETLAIIAYRQPVTRVDIEMIRGVSSDSAIRTLLERKFITLSGRAKTIGRPLLYSTTNEFLKYFSLDSLNDLPKMEEIEELLSDRESESQQSLDLGTDRADPTVVSIGENLISEEDPVYDDTDNYDESDDQKSEDPIADKPEESIDQDATTEYPVNLIDEPEEKENKDIVTVEKTELDAIEQLKDEEEEEPVNAIAGTEEF